MFVNMLAFADDIVFFCSIMESQRRSKSTIFGRLGWSSNLLPFCFFEISESYSTLIGLSSPAVADLSATAGLLVPLVGPAKL